MVSGFFELCTVWCFYYFLLMFDLLRLAMERTYVPLDFAKREHPNVVTTPYYDSIQLIERLHRYFLDVLKVELDKKGIQDINNVQSMILHNIGDDELTVGELTIRGYYLGSNVSYNVKKMVENGYLEQERSVHDKRSIRVKLSQKGKDLRDAVTAMFERHETMLEGTVLTEERLKHLNETMQMIEKFWANQTNFSGLASL